jgi:DNA-3-methyladenine glycosylase
MNRARSPGKQPRLPTSFYRRDPRAVARALLGQLLVTTLGGRRTAGIIVETEAYLGAIDKAAHTYGNRRTARNESMWGEAGHAYVYFVYGMHHCVNVVAGSAGDPVAVLLRALEPVEGLQTMFERRAAARRPLDLCSGPAKLCQALGITRELDGADLQHDPSIGIERLRKRALAAGRIGSGPRVGIDYAEEWRHEPLRFWMRGSPHVSR